MQLTETLRDAAILVALILLAMSVRVTALPDSPFDGSRTQAAEPVVAAPHPTPGGLSALPSRATPTRAVPSEDAGDGVAVDCERHQRLTLRGDGPGDLVVIEIDIDPRLGKALGLCAATDDDPRGAPAGKA